MPTPVDLAHVATETTDLLQPRDERRYLLGPLPLVALTSSTGILVSVLASSAAREGGSHAREVFWCALLLIVVPAGWVVSGKNTQRIGRIGAVLCVGLGFYLVKVLQYPLVFTYPDEFSDWRTTHDILLQGHLFSDNPLRQMSPAFPGLDITTAAVARLGGVSVFTAGVLVLGAARILLALSLYLFFEQVSGSQRIGGLSAVIYFANPSFLFFDAQYSYESLAIPLGALVLWLAARRRRSGRHRRASMLAALLVIAALSVTHHVASYGLAAFLALWTVIASVQRVFRGRSHGATPAPLAAAAIAASLLWLVFAARQTLDYLGYVIVPAVLDFLSLVAGDAAARAPFTCACPAGTSGPVFDRALGFASVGLIVIALPIGLLLSWRRLRAQPAAVALALTAAAYPVLLSLRLTASGFESSNRASEFIFIGLGLVIALVASWWLRTGSRWRHGVVVACLAILFMGGVTVGWPYQLRLPGPYLVAGEQRAITQETVDLADWTRAYLPSESHVLADRMASKMLGSYGGLNPVKRSTPEGHVSDVITRERLERRQRAIVRQKQIRFVAIDRRMAKAIPFGGFYFESSEPGAYRHRRPLRADALAKFDHIDRVSRLYDGGNLVVYDLDGCCGSGPSP